MFKQAGQNLALPERLVRYSVATRIGLVLLVFFSAAWCVLQWTLTFEPRFMVEGVTRQFVMLEAFACATAAVIAFVFMLANGIAWLAAVIKLRREQGSRRAMQRAAHRIGAYV